jgi:hypothetical protein
MVSTISHDHEPRSTASPLKSSACDADGWPVRERRWMKS